MQNAVELVFDSVIILPLAPQQDDAAAIANLLLRPDAETGLIRGYRRYGIGGTF